MVEKAWTYKAKSSKTRQFFDILFNEGQNKLL